MVVLATLILLGIEWYAVAKGWRMMVWVCVISVIAISIGRATNSL